MGTTQNENLAQLCLDRRPLQVVLEPSLIDTMRVSAKHMARGVCRPMHVAQHDIM